MIAVHAAFAAAAGAGILFLHYCQPWLYMALVVEDFWGDYATFTCYMLAFLFLSAAAVKNRNVRKPGYLLVALAMFVIAMEEISWGQRIFRVQAPGAIARLNYQSELTIHNMLDYGQYAMAERLFAMAVLFWAFLLPFAAQRVGALRALMARWGIPQVRLGNAILFLPALAFFVLDPVVRSDEIRELLLAVAFVCFAQATLFGAVDRAARYPAVVARRLLGLFAMVSVATAALVSTCGATTSGRAGTFAWHLYRTAAIDYPQKQLYRQAEVLFENILARDWLMRDWTLIQYGVLLNQAGDPKAESVLERALQRESEREASHPGDPQYSRNKGILYKLLGMDEEAGAEFERSIQKDRARLLGVRGDRQEYELALSLAKTAIAAEDYGFALENLNRAKGLAPDAREQATVRGWMERIVAEGEMTRSQYLQTLQYIYL